MAPLIAAPKLVNCEGCTKRPIAHFPSDMWGDDFVTFTPQHILEMERCMKEIEPLKEEVKKMVMDKTMNVSKKMSLIDVIERLGVSYYFEDHIKDVLNKVFEYVKDNDFYRNHIGCNNLYDTALQFRIFRQHGFNIPSDVFSEFMNKEGKFDNNLKSDAKGMLCLYEAAHLRIHGEYILDEALAFTTKFLESNTTSYNQNLIHHALKHPLHWSMPRIQTRIFISVYQDDESRNETLLQLAVLDFNKLQLLYRQELCQILKWWKDLDFVTKLPYARSRWVENHFTSLSIFFEPHYSFARVLLAKLMLLVSIVDDSYDAYGTFEELQLLTDAFERWDLTATKEFPAEYMKLVYDFVLKTYDEVSKEMSKRGKSYANQFMKDHLIEIIRSYFVETKWLKERYVPTFEEYMVNGRKSILASFVIAVSLMGMDEIEDAKPFQQIIQEPKAIIACQTICRLKNDMEGHQEEQRRAHVASSVECYMENYEMSREEAVKCLNEIIENGLKDINEAFLVRTRLDGADDLPLPLLKRILNSTRCMFVLYGDETDGYTRPAKLIKDDIISTYASPITI